NEPGDPGAYWPAFAETVTAYRLDSACFLDMLAGQDEDLDHRGYETDAELSSYCYRVASTVGLLCMAIWGLRAGADPALARKLAISRGQAFQRTNILRDLAEDFDESPRRLYLPRESLRRFALTPDELRTWARPDACIALVNYEATIARSHYNASAPLEDMIEPSCRPTLWAMTRIYEGILRQVEATPELVVAPVRAGLSRRRKLAIALTASVRARAAR
ncbi:MAG: squalene/phytoene synthase family protein, partial [Phycisphaerales bacterium]|nr:squalene/phytoene synthase family protein [Phycisphaerales bacterium]